ncbi:MAG: hypothetical protein JW987_15295 [Anaerolineaceae bacterium]|nr:hypothetical protein [Anaerolineaceae bacterium]
MKERIVLLSVLILLLAGLFILSSRPVTAQDDQPPTPSAPIETMGENTRELESISPNALVGFIGTSNPYCYQPDPARDECYINIRYMQATDNGTTSPYLYTLEVRLDGKLRYQSSVFFENSIYYNYDMIPDGLKVTCGSPNQGGAGVDFGKVYSLAIQAKSGDGTNMGGNYAGVRCPAYVP